ncbi:hypothetical protein SEMRO_2168_G317320.1 [Seminavis robusta]|uniref:Uncharacterized protein n=1 Tax=Seminavis robusta TaxID=568900 RepID=A0A9N8EYT7_9STRA|nr:hypothetical protein SEMRO_2168_G317320.1 [Seminavis robusta]|eukprot:Sro2168_g317320.1 n/a (180) ;mRNA; f:3583-4232
MAAACNAILKSEDEENDLEPRRWKHVLFVFLDEMVVSSDLESETASIHDQKQMLNLRLMQIKKTLIGEGTNQEEMEQMFFPSFFSFRVIDEDAQNELNLKTKKKKGSNAEESTASEGTKKSKKKTKKKPKKKKRTKKKTKDEDSVGSNSKAGGGNGTDDEENDDDDDASMASSNKEISY